MIYDALLFLAFPKIFWDRWKRGRVRPHFSERLGKTIPEPKGKPVFWIHAVSVGEIKSAQTLFLKLKKEFPTHFFLITTTTATGQEEAKRSLPTADAFAFLPLDFSWIMRKWVKTLKPTHFILIESDFWYNLLKCLKAQGAKIALVSGKISARSANRFRWVPFFSKKLFSCFDLLCVQNREYFDRFSPFAKPIIAGNLKVDISPKTISPPHWETDLFPITISCTHEPEEELLLISLKPLLDRLQIFLAPRHPERFDSVEKTLERLKIPTIRWSQIEKRGGDERVILIDSMGNLPIFYTLSRLVIVAGSFIDKIGGHNVLEPLYYGTPSLFGPHTETQKDLVEIVKKGGAGFEVTADQLGEKLKHLIENPTQILEMKKGAERLISESKGVVEKVFSLLIQKEFGDK